MILNPPRMHHDGSDLYVSNSSPQLGDEVRVRLRIEKDFKPDHVQIRTVFDGEPGYIEAQLADQDDQYLFYDAILGIRNKPQNYRWLVTRGESDFWWISQRGISAVDVSDISDFKIFAHDPTPTWMNHSVVYQIFPDRFSRSEKTYEKPDHLVARDWNLRPEGRSHNTGKEWFGGDLWGVADKLDYIKELGADVVYLTPFFAANSTHRYDAKTFNQVDPLLGGDEALINLVKEAHKRGMKVVGDITLNHCGQFHEWFTSARAGNAETREFFTFDEKLPHGYECWLGHSSLPKFNFTSEKLREILITGENSIIKHWLSEPFNMDGWRVDVANMAGRQGELDLTHEIARLTRIAVQSCGEEKILIAEHFHDAGLDLMGDGWQGGMNYTGVRNPVWEWLSCSDFLKTRKAGLDRLKTLGANQIIESINDFASQMPWKSRQDSWSLVGSHDTARIRSVAGSEAGQIAAAAMLIGLPGTPMIFMGDELGAEGLWGEDSRTTIDWDNLDISNSTIFKAYQELFEIRRNSDALANGGIEWLASSEDALAFVRESKNEKLLFVISRNATKLDLPALFFKHQSAKNIFGDYDLVSDRVVANQAGASIWRVSQSQD